jgi:dUTP pyrophosphatase
MPIRATRVPISMPPSPSCSRPERARSSAPAIALPDGYVAFVVPRSGLAFKHGITIVNAPGTVDAGYRGEIKVALLNTDSGDPYTIEAGDRIAQLVVMPVSRARFVEVERLPGSLRGDGGFGSTGFGEHKSGVNA